MAIIMTCAHMGSLTVTVCIIVHLHKMHVFRLNPTISDVFSLFVTLYHVFVHLKLETSD